MIVVGGASNRELSVEGAAYEPRRKRWRVLPPSPAGFPSTHRIIWTGEEALLWGGRTAGASYHSAMDAWRRLPPAPVRRRFEHSAVWTGREMIVWAGEACSDACFRADGAAYDPS